MHCLLLGRDHANYGDVTSVAVGPQSAAAISVGQDLTSPSLKYKGDLATPNEDALCVIDTGGRVAMVVADAHFGDEASAELVERAYDVLVEKVPDTPAQLQALVEALGRDPQPYSESESTLLIVVFDRATRHGFATSYGDSTLAIVSAAGEYRQVNSKDDRYVAAGEYELEGAGSSSAFTVVPGDAVLVFTDGVDECHYRRPATSVRPEHIVGVVAKAAGRPELMVEWLAEMALAGVDGNPGGQDNIAIIAAIA